MNKRLSNILLGTTGALLIIVLVVLVSGSSKELPQQYSETIICAPEPLTAMDSMILRYDKLMDAQLDSLRTVGAAFAISHMGETAFMKCYGVKESGSSDSINNETIFRLASVSKTVTGVLAGILDAKDAIDFDDRVKDHLPGFQLRDSLNAADLKVRHILSHTSGLVPHAYDNLVEAQVPYSVIYDSLHRVNISGPPGKYYGYQNFVYSLYDTLCESCLDKSFASALQDEVFDPLEMNEASVGYFAFTRNSNKALPHSGQRTLKLNDRYYLTNPAAGVNASIHDMSKLINALTMENNPLLPTALSDSIFQPQVYTPLKWYYLRRWGKVDSRHYGIGWRIIGYKGRTIAYHGGYVQGYRAEIAVCPEENIAMVYLSNSPNSVGSYSVPTFLNMYFDFIAERAPHQQEEIQQAHP